jgi:hypothetical protein
MHRIKLIGPAVIAVLLLGVIVSASALASGPKAKFLSGASSATFSGTSGKGKLATSKNEVKCTSDENKGTIGETEGEATIVFKGCEALGEKCNTTGKGSGEVESHGTTLLVYDSLSPLAAADLFNVDETVFECTSLVKNKVLGTILLLVKPIGEDTTKLELVVEESGGSPTDKTYWNSAGEEKHPLLLSSLDGGTFLESGDTSEENFVTTEMVDIEA